MVEHLAFPGNGDNGDDADATTPPLLPTPLHDYVLLEPQRRGERMEGGLVVPEIVSDEPMEGLVLAVGPGRLHESGEWMDPPLCLAKGARVVYAKYAGFELEVARTTYKLVRVDEILAVYDPQ